ncbi:glycosyltransferase [Pseudoalteromonas arctica]|uniref:Glycosyltransferase n=1 Tax=Pseudoalteromonas arctica TaxID=394751 RepID=A0ABU9TH02_9GAMM
MQKVAVIISVYKSDNVSFIDRAIKSILDQTYNNIEVFIQVDGVVSDKIKHLLIDYSKIGEVNVYFNDKNMGLATRLNNSIDTIVKLGGYNYIARMDADDISDLNRIETQVTFLNNNPDIDIVGSDVIEISELEVEMFYKKMDSSHHMLAQNIIKKCPFNHPSVMFRCDIFEEGFRYDSSLMNTQDYYLWVDLLSAGKRFANINKPLLKFRVNSEFHSRRGFKKAKNDFKSRIYAFKKLNVLSFSNVFHTITLFLLRLAPTSIKKWAYNNFR